MVARGTLGTLLLIGLAVMLGCGGGGVGGGGGVIEGQNSGVPLSFIQGLNNIFYSTMIVFAYNDLGMHCMNDDFSKLLILPPFNNLRAVVIERGEEPEIRTTGLTVRYRIASNTRSSGKTNFWTYVGAALGVSPAPNVGLTGNGMAGRMAARPREHYWEASGIPLTPILDNGQLDPYPLGEISVVSNRQTVARTHNVVPVSWEMNCDLCHSGGADWEADVLRDHDRLHGTNLTASAPVACGTCHAQPPLSAITGPGNPALKTLSASMHGAHAPRMGQAGRLEQPCYACHPGIETQCQRDVHNTAGMGCVDCHGEMTRVADPTRRPWQDLPRCGGCHRRAGFTFEDEGKLYTQSVGHQEVPCQACHGSPHAITPTRTPRDNRQAIALQGHVGPIDDCRLCHIERPDDRFEHHH